MPKLPIYVVDSFTSRPFHGNPAAVCIVNEWPEEGWMASVAAEMRHSETAFVCRGEHLELRWFTPTVEVDLCGHATLAAAHVLWSLYEGSASNDLVFQTKSGSLHCSKHGYGIQMDFPAERAVSVDEEKLAIICFALGIRPEVAFAGKNRMDYFVELGSENPLADLAPDMQAISDLGGRGLIVCESDRSGEYDFRCRFFAPNAGVPEDPVTGSAFCCLGPYWGAKLGKDDVTGYQASDRGGVVRVGVRGERVLLQGHAVTILEGELCV